MKRSDIVKQFHVWESAESSQRFGQWFLNTHFPQEIATEIFYCENPRKALNMIVNDNRFCDDEWLNQWAQRKLDDLDGENPSFG